MDRDESPLLDLLNYARQARDFSAGVAWERFSKDRMLQFATQHSLQCIGEAAWKVSKEYQSAQPHIPWKKIAAPRHRMVHDYPRVELPKVWAVVETHFGPLIAALEPLVPPQPAPPERSA